MAAGVCMNCGMPIPPGTATCASCGQPVGGPPAGPDPSIPFADSGVPPPPPSPAPAVAAPPLSVLLGVQSSRKFLLQHVLVGPKHSYRVLDPEGRHLFTVGENVRDERQAQWDNLVRLAGPGESAVHIYWGGVPHPVRAIWAVDDFAGHLRGTVTLRVEHGAATATVADLAGVPSFTVSVTRGVMSITAVAAGPDGRPMLETRGNLIGHTFSLHGPGDVELARIHEAMVSVRDTYHLDLVGTVDPVAALVFAILIDHYKGK
jgi:hypothetical protein